MEFAQFGLRRSYRRRRKGQEFRRLDGQMEMNARRRGDAPFHIDCIIVGRGCLEFAGRIVVDRMNVNVRESPAVIVVRICVDVVERRLQVGERERYKGDSG